MIHPTQKRVLLLAAVVLVLVDLPAVSACFWGINEKRSPTDNNELESEDAEASTTTEAPRWFRCKQRGVNTGHFCRQTECNSTAGEIPLANTNEAGYYSEAHCLKTILYQQCYDYDRDSTGFGSCQGDFVGCDSPNQKKLSQLLDDNTCGLSMNYLHGNAVYSRCVAGMTGESTCRPVGPVSVGCSKDETSTGYAYFSDTECINSGIVPTSYVRCISGDSFKCKLLVVGCDSSETRWPATATFATLGHCNYIGAPLYNLCYDFYHQPTTYIGTCQFADIECSYPEKRKVISGVPDHTCAKSALEQASQYVRCQDGSTFNCRPLTVGCLPFAEAMNPTGRIFSSIAECAGYVPQNVLCASDMSGSYAFGCQCVDSPDQCNNGGHGSIDLALARITAFKCSDVCTNSLQPPNVYACFMDMGPVAGSANICLPSPVYCEKMTPFARAARVGSFPYPALVNCIEDQQ